MRELDTLGARFERGDCRQRLSFQKLQERAAGGRNVVDAVGRPNLLIAAIVSPPPAIEKAFESAIACASVCVPCANASISNMPTGRSRRSFPRRQRLRERRGGLRADVEDHFIGCISRTALVVARARAEASCATTTSSGSGTRVAASIALPARQVGSASDCPIGIPLRG
jgi:hypothetical protein